MSDKMEAIQNAPIPRNLTGLKSYIGLLTYYGKFIPNLASRLAPLYDLLKKDVAWYWGPKQQAAFDKSKQLLTSSQLLIHFDPKLPLLLAHVMLQHMVLVLCWRTD